MENREMKFRAWDPKRKVMEYDADNMSPLGTSLNQTIKTVQLFRNLMQCTGFIDKNSKETYEGDIAKNPLIGDLWEVVFLDGMFQYKLIHEEVVEPIAFMEEPWEVIGNIYENSDLVYLEEE